MMAPEKLICTINPPPICSDCKNGPTLNTTCEPKENTSPSVATMLYTRLRNHFLQKRNASKFATRQNHYEKLSSISISVESMSAGSTTKVSKSRRRINNLLSYISILTIILSTIITTVSSNPVFVDNPDLAQFQSGRNIRHLPCIVRKSGRSGVCMFAIDCIKQNGTHLGTCIDRFYFGSCCDIKEDIPLFTPEIGDNSIDQNTISHHFTPESTTMPTSALFKINTLPPLYTNQTEQQSQGVKTTVSHITTINSAQDTQRPSTQTITGGTMKPSVSISTTTSTTTSAMTTSKPHPSTTHKHSHFVVRTTAKPFKTSNTFKPTTIRRKTTPTSITSPSTSTAKRKPTPSIASFTSTTTRPILTTTPGKLSQDEILVDSTTPPLKLFTFQSVETTVATPTESTNVFDFVTTQRTQTKIPKPSTPVNISTTSNKPTTTPQPTTTTLRTSPKTKPPTSRKPIATKKPSSSKRTTIKPSRKPLPTTTEDEIVPLINNSFPTSIPSSSSTVSYLPSSTESTTLLPDSSSTTNHKSTITKVTRPKPTATIIKVTKPTATSIKTTQKISATSSVTSATTEDEKQTSNASTSSTAQQTTTKMSTTAPATNTTTTTTPIPTLPSTTISSTSLKPGLVTWTNVDAEPASPEKPSLSDWIPVTASASPADPNNTFVSTTGPEIGSSDTLNVNEIIGDNSAIKPTMKPLPSKEPANTEHPTTLTFSLSSTTSTQIHKNTTTTTEGSTVTTSTEHPKTTKGPSTTTTFTSPTYRPLSTATTTEMPLISFTTVSPLSSTDAVTDTITTEGPTNVTTPVNSLEGVDYRQICGRRMFPEPRIVGGSNAAFGRWPWQISLRQWRTSTYLHKCGAALLNENWAITAAHCVDNVPPSDLLLRLGEYDLAEEEEPYGYQERRVQIVASHPQFDPRTFEYDLALLRFYEPVTFQPNIIPVCVPDSDENFIGQTAFVTGWGRLYEDGPLPSVLQEVAVPVINNTICESMYRSAGYIEHIPHIFICAGWKKGGYDSCEGDSGGPMVLQRESDKRFQLGGVISWGIGCAEANQPGVYTRISEFRDWINQILQF